MKKNMIYILIWIAVIIISIINLQGFFKSKRLVKSCVLGQAEVTEVTSNRIRTTNTKNSKNRTVISYYLVQGFRVSYTYDGKEYESTIRDVETFLESSTLKIPEATLMKYYNRKGYNKGNVVGIYIEKNNPQNIYMSNQLNTKASIAKYIIAIVMFVFAGVIGTVLVRGKVK